MDQPFFSVIIPTFNQANFLAETLKSLKSQTFKDFEVIIIDNFSNSNHSVIDKLETICNKKINSLNINCTNKNELVNNIDWQNIIGIIHFAALKSVSESFEKKKKYFFNNIESTKVLIDIAENYNIDNFVFSSSCTVYGSPDLLPVTEKTKLKN